MEENQTKVAEATGAGSGLAELEPNWRQQAKELGISLYHRKKEDVLKEIAEMPLAEKTEAEISAKESIEPINERKKYEVGDLTPVEELMRRIETLENRVNLIILRINRFVDAVSKSKRTKGL